MAITATNLLATGSAVSGNSYVTASLSVTAGRMYLLSVRSRSGAGTGNTPTVTGAGQTWTQVATRNDAGDATKRLTVFRCIAASTTSGALTIDFAGQAQTAGIGWIVDEFTGMTPGNNGANAIVQTIGGDSNEIAVSSFSLTLSAFGSASNATYGSIYAGATASAVTQAAGYTELADNGTGLGRGETEFLASSDTTPSWTLDSRVVAAAIAVEIALATPKTVSPAATSLALTAASPSVPLAAPSTAALTLTMATPTISVGVFASPAATALTLTMGTPTVAIASVPAPSVEVRIGWRPDQFNHLTNPDFETNTTGWSVSADINGAATSITRITTDFHSGAACGRLICPATALTGVNYSFGTQPFYAVATYMSVYRFVVWLKSVSGTTQARLIIGSIGTSSDRASRDVTLTTDWQPFYLDWAPSATRTDVELAIVNIPAVAMTALIDDVNVFLRDALTQVENGYFTTDNSGWSVSAAINAAATSITRQASGGYYGSACGRLVTTATNGSGMNWPFGTSRFTLGRMYRARVWARSVSGSTSARLRLGSSGTPADRGDTTIALTTDWAAYTVDWTPSASRTDAQLAITNGSAAAVTVDVDGVEVYEALDDISSDAFGPNGSAALSYGRGAAFDGSGQASGFANVTVYNALTNGKYAPENSSGVLYGLLTPGRRVLIRAKYAGVPYGLFYGTVRRFVPNPMALTCEIRCEDPLFDLSRIRWHRRTSFLSAHDYRVFALQASTVYNYSSENGPIERLGIYGGSEYSSVLEYISAIDNATGSLHFAKPSVYASVGWQLVMRDRTVHSDASTPSETWNDDLSDLSGYEVTDEALINHQRVAVAAYTVAPTRSIVYAYQPEAHSLIDDMDGKFYFDGPDISGQPPVEQMPLTVPANTIRVLQFQYSPSTRTPSIAVTYTSGSCAETTDSGPGWATLTLAAGSVDAVIQSIVLSAAPMWPLPLNNEEWTDEEAAYLDQEHAGNDISSPYINHPAHAFGLARYRVWRWKRGRARPSLLRHNLFASQLTREVSDRVTVTFARLNVSSKVYAINSFTTTVSQNARDWQTTYQVEELPATPAGGWFTLGTSALDGTAVLDY